MAEQYPTEAHGIAARLAWRTSDGDDPEDMAAKRSASRANAQTVLNLYAARPGSACGGDFMSEDYGSDLVDLVTDLLHLADTIPDATAKNGEDAARMALGHYRAEQLGGDDSAHPAVQTCRGCGATFPHDPQADFCPGCAADNAGEPTDDRGPEHQGDALDVHHEEHPPAVYVVTRRADTGEAEPFCALTTEGEADDLAAALNARDGAAYTSEATFEPVYKTARDAWEELLPDEPYTS